MPGEDLVNVDHGGGGVHKVEGTDQQSQAALDHQALPPPTNSNQQDYYFYMRQHSLAMQKYSLADWLTD